MTEKARRDRYSALPEGAVPRLMAREAAAQWMGVSASKFDELVVDGRAPKPKRIDGRKLWDRLRLDAAIDALPDEDEANPWDARHGHVQAAGRVG